MLPGHTIYLLALWLLNALPSTLPFCLGTHWETTWPLMLEFITKIDFANHPDSTFQDEPSAGGLMYSYLSQQRQHQQQQRLQQQQQQQQLAQHHQH
ncbi:hypothetical protein [Parasitella parasitica]|uniref:Ndc10 domain-containing protein n=1 Tax=Parasitella parasitica TaxID=35722 RepID=A0A0B7MSA2_9FUNG|nr:hypothetical protein [Parasitella parasitica]